MRVYITNINGQSAQSTAQLCQNTVTDVAVSLGYRELGIYCYQIHTDSERCCHFSNSNLEYNRI